MKRGGIPEEIKEKSQTIIAKFNKKTFKKDKCFYEARFRGKFLYLDRNDNGVSSPVCRLTYNGDPDDWDFAIFKWSSESYDPDEWMFPGIDYVDGTIEGAMKAGLEAYPISQFNLQSILNKLLKFRE